MMKPIYATFLTLAMIGSADAAIEIQIQDSGEQSVQYFGDGQFLLVRGGEHRFGVEPDGTCWFVYEGRRVSGACTEMTKASEDFQQQMMDMMPAEQRQFMQQLMSRRGPQQPVEVTEAGTEHIAGFESRCSRIGSSRTICTSKSLQKKIEEEMGGSSFADLQHKFGGSKILDQLGMSDPAEDAAADLAKRGYVMKDVQAVTGIPGMSSAMLQFIPADKRNEIMKQMNNGAGANMAGPTVVAVDENATMPNVDTAGSTPISFAEFISGVVQQMMRE